MESKDRFTQILDHLEPSIEYLYNIENQIIGSFLLSFGINPNFLMELMETKNYSVIIFMPTSVFENLSFKTRSHLPSRLQIYQAPHLDQSILIEIRGIDEKSNLKVYNYEFSIREMRLLTLIDRIPRFEGDGLDNNLVKGDSVISMGMVLEARKARKEREKRELEERLVEAVGNSEWKIMGLTLSPRNDVSVEGIGEDVLHILNKNPK